MDTDAIARIGISDFKLDTIAHGVAHAVNIAHRHTDPDSGADSDGHADAKPIPDLDRSAAIPGPNANLDLRHP